MDSGATAERILSLTLQMISLLTGEEYMVVRNTRAEDDGRSRHRSPITTALHPLLQKSSRHLLKITHQITELLTGEVTAGGLHTGGFWEMTGEVTAGGLHTGGFWKMTGEVPLRCRDVALYFSLEEWDYVEGHWDRYQDMMEGLRPRSSPDGSSRRNPPERCPAPVYSQDCPEENILENDQDEDLIDIKVEVVDEDEETDFMAEQQYVRDPPERCPAPLYSQDSPEGHQDEEERMMSDQPYMSDVKEKIPEDETTEKPRTNVVENVMLSLLNGVEDEDIMQNSSGEILNNLHPRLYSNNLSYSHPSHMEYLHEQLQMITNTGHKCGKRFQCGDCGKQFTQSSSLFIHRRIHTGEKPFTCSLCGKCFTRKSGLDQHERRHTGEKLYSCLVCGKCFVDKSNLVKHDRIHTGEKPYSCLECGKRFTNKSHLVLHERSHTGEKPFSCSECEKCFTNRSHLVTHERIHTGEKPYLCSECGKCFITKTKLRNHQKIHTGEKPFTCSECGKCYINKSDLVKHERVHTGEKPYSCSECEKCFTDKSSLVAHQRIHPGESSFSECGI